MWRYITTSSRYWCMNNNYRLLCAGFQWRACVCGDTVEWRSFVDVGRRSRVGGRYRGAVARHTAPVPAPVRPARRLHGRARLDLGGHLSTAAARARRRRHPAPLPSRSVLLSDSCSTSTAIDRLPKLRKCCRQATHCRICDGAAVTYLSTLTAWRGSIMVRPCRWTGDSKITGSISGPSAFR